MNNEKYCLAIGVAKDAIHAIKKAQSLGYKVVALDGDKEAAGLRVADVSICVDIRDLNKVLDVIKDYKIEFILPVPIGRWLLTTGRVNSKIGLPGIKEEAVEICIDKYWFHRILSEKKLRNNKLVLLKEIDDLEKVDFFPCIIKPRYGSGSVDVCEISNKEELLQKSRQIDFSKDFLVEGKFEGQEYGVDGAILDGKLKIVLVRKKINTKPPYCQCVGYFGVSNSEIDIYSSIKKYLTKVVECLKVDNSLFHADIMVSKDEISVIEMSPRPSGHNLHDVFTPICSGVDIVQEYINYILGGKYNFDPLEQRDIYLMHFWDFTDCTIDYVPHEQEIESRCKDNLVRYECNIKVGEKLGMIKNGTSVVNRGYVILKGRDEDELIQRFFELRNLFKIRSN